MYASRHKRCTRGYICTIGTAQAETDAERTPISPPKAIRTQTFSVSGASFLESIEVEGEPEGSNNGGGADDGRDQDLLVSRRSSDPVNRGEGAGLSARQEESRARREGGNKERRGWWRQERGER